MIHAQPEIATVSPEKAAIRCVYVRSLHLILNLNVNKLASGLVSRGLCDTRYLYLCLILAEGTASQSSSVCRFVMG